MNPQHTLPTIDDNGFILWESRAICAYLVDKYAKTDALYPRDPQKRATIDQRMYFDLGTLSQRFGEFFYPQIKLNKPADSTKKQKCIEALEMLNTMIAGHTYAAGDSLSIADMLLMAMVSTYELIGFDLRKFVNISKWYGKCKDTIPNYDVNVAGLEIFNQWLEKADYVKLI